MSVQNCAQISNIASNVSAFGRTDELKALELHPVSELNRKDLGHFVYSNRCCKTLPITRGRLPCFGGATRLPEKRRSVLAGVV